MFSDSFAISPELICRDDSCKRLGIHLAHGLVEVGLGEGKLEQAWTIPCPRALRRVVYRQVSPAIPRNARTIWRLVQNDYGSTTLRAVNRHLSGLSRKQKIVRVDLGNSFFAYLRPAITPTMTPNEVDREMRRVQRVAGDLDFIREQIIDMQAGAEGACYA